MAGAPELDDGAVLGMGAEDRSGPKVPVSFPKPEPLKRKRMRVKRTQAKARRACVDAVWQRAASPFPGDEMAWCERCKAIVYRPWATDRPLKIGHVHEVKPRSLGGDPTDPKGCLLLCCRCHAEAHRLKVGAA
jgi:hypothetical protein